MQSDEAIGMRARFGVITSYSIHYTKLYDFSPVDKMRLVEIIKGARTSPETLAKAYDTVLAIGKTPIVRNNFV